jgi:hypothetical protein
MQKQKKPKKTPKWLNVSVKVRFWVSARMHLTPHSVVCTVLLICYVLTRGQIHPPLH